MKVTPDGPLVPMHDMLFWTCANIQFGLGQKMKIRKPANVRELELQQRYLP
jgi:hypothetical protein